MKKIVMVILCFSFFIFSNAFAFIKPGNNLNEQNFNGKDYVGEIVGALYDLANNDPNNQEILLFTLNDGKNESNLSGLTLIIDKQDLPFGFTLANSVGKKIAVVFSESTEPKVSRVYIVTDRFYYGEKANQFK